MHFPVVCLQKAHADYKGVKYFTTYVKDKNKITIVENIDPYIPIL